MANEYQLSYTGEQIDEKLSKVEPTGVTEGTYGGYTSPTYNIPNITVDEYGRVTNASVSALTLATAKSNGLIDYTMYSYVAGNTHLSTQYGIFDLDDAWHLIGLSDPDVAYYSYTNPSTSAISYQSAPKVYAVYVQAYPDESATAGYWIPAPHYISAVYDYSKGNSTGVYVKFPSEYKDANINRRSTVHYVVLYERKYPSSSSTTM